MAELNYEIESDSFEEDCFHEKYDYIDSEIEYGPQETHYDNVYDFVGEYTIDNDTIKNQLVSYNINTNSGWYIDRKKNKVNFRLEIKNYNIDIEAVSIRVYIEEKPLDNTVDIFKCYITDIAYVKSHPKKWNRAYYQRLKYEAVRVLSPLDAVDDHLCDFLRFIAIKIMNVNMEIDESDTNYIEYSGNC